MRNAFVMQVNNIMIQVTDGEGLPEGVDRLPACVDELDQKIQALAATMCVAPNVLPDVATPAARDQLKIFVTKQVEEIQIVSQLMGGKKIDNVHAFPADEDISKDFLPCGGPNNDRLGFAGGFGVTYKRRYKPTGKVYAFKEINVDHATKQGVDEDHLLKEAETLQKISHLNVVRCYHSFFSDDGIRFYLVMELVDGQTLDQVLKTSSYQSNPEQLLKWLTQMARALVYMHEDCNIIHRDLKPENVMVTRGMEDIKIIDFGMARFMPSAAGSVTMTAGVGTQFYMSWAKKHGKPYDGRDDVWAVGCIMLELLRGMSMIRQTPICDEDVVRARQFQYAKQTHVGIGSLIEAILAKKNNDAIPYATQLLVMFSDYRALKATASALSPAVGKLSKSDIITDANDSSTHGNPDPSTSGKASSKYSKEAAKAGLMKWLMDNVAGFTVEDAEECAAKCTKQGCNTIALLGEEYVIMKQEGATNADNFISSLLEVAPLRRKLRQVGDDVLRY
ncbi:serine/threonine protein kinase [archaeon]|nr:MAG: serine/threonine protein kinase [archaeon]